MNEYRKHQILYVRSVGMPEHLRGKLTHLSGAGPSKIKVFYIKALDNARAQVEDLRTGNICIVETKYIEFCANVE